MSLVQELFDYREMIVSLVHRDLKGRYKNSVLGFAWMFVNPLLQLLVYTLVFSVIMRNGISDYYLFLFVALIPWIFFSSCVSGGCTCIINQGDMVKKIFFPREVLPLSYVISQFVNMCLCFLVVFAVLIISGKGLNPIALLFLPWIMVVEFVLALGTTLLFSALTVYFRDMIQILGIITMAWQFLTPVMYSSDMVPEEVRWAFNLNPMSAVIDAYRDILYYKRIPETTTMLMALAMGIILIVIGEIVFSHFQKHFAENL